MRRGIGSSRRMGFDRIALVDQVDGVLDLGGLGWGAGSVERGWWQRGIRDGLGVRRGGPDWVNCYGAESRELLAPGLGARYGIVRQEM